jgi:hypothetical protein
MSLLNQNYRIFVVLIAVLLLGSNIQSAIATNSGRTLKGKDGGNSTKSPSRKVPVPSTGSKGKDSKPSSTKKPKATKTTKPVKPPTTKMGKGKKPTV